MMSIGEPTSRLRGRTKLCDRAFQNFIENLLASEIRPGQFVSQRELVEVTGMSLAAIREPIPRLEANELIETMPQRGMQIATADLKPERDAFQLSLTLEKAGDEALRASDENIRALAETHEDPGAAGPRPGRQELAGGGHTTMRPLILLGTEDIDFYMLLDHILEGEGFRCILATSVEEILNVSLEHSPEVIVLDCRPHSYSATDGLHRLKQKAETNSIPIVALISPGAEIEHVQLLKSGVDEAFTRPISPAKLVEQIRMILIGLKRPTLPNENNLRYADVEMDPITYRVRRNGKDIHLGPIEFKLLRHLLQTPEQVFSRDELITAAWPHNVYVGPRTVDVHMGRLRKALKLASDQELIRTVRAAGYALTDRPEDDASKAE
jgi:two-component system phosphate regulon response regulator PhoB